MRNSIRISLVAVGLCLTAMTLPSFADDMSANQAATYKEIEGMFGKVPEFVKKFPKTGIVGAWEEVKSLELSDKTALSPKVKSLISLAVAAQIPCEYCIYSDTISAKNAGATDEEIAEAVGMAALTRHWSTVFHGLQIDLAQFKKDMGGQ
jgi:AhpD family alkylhydroperoxidase